MIVRDKFQQALRALSHVLVLGRQMAYDEALHKDIADVLDTAEYLPRLLASEEDETKRFRDCLVGLADRWPDFAAALQYFDDPTVRWPW